MLVVEGINKKHRGGSAVTGVISTLSLVIALSLAFWSTGSAEGGGILKNQLSKLAQENGFKIKGLKKILDDPARDINRDTGIEAQLAGLLEGYNYVLVTDASGTVTLVHILKRLERFKAEAWTDQSTSEPQQPAQPQLPAQTASQNNDHVIRTTPSAGAHYVDATLTGPNGDPIDLFLQVDTGADAIMLPVSQIEFLGFDREEDLEAGSTTTSTGWVPTESGILWLVEVGSAEADNVAVRFIEDRYFRHEGLLGRSFLSRFDYVLDDAKAQLTLTEK